MSVILKPNWTFEELVEAAWIAYSSPMQFAGYRINTIKTWGNVVGKSVALARLHEYIAKHGTKARAAKHAGMSYSTLRGIELFYESLPDDFIIIRLPTDSKYKQGQNLDLEEDLYNEFKSVSSKNPVRTICDTFSRYAIGFLNSEGGRIFWGIEDTNATVEGIALTAADRDQIRIGIQAKISNIQPKVDPTTFKIHFFEVEGARHNLFIIIVEIPKANNGRVYFTESGECWVRTSGVTQKVVGPAIQELILGKQTFYS